MSKMFFEVLDRNQKSLGTFEAATKESALWAARPDGPEQGDYAVLVEEEE